MSKPIKFSNIPALLGPPLLVSPRLSKKKLNKSKFYRKSKGNNSQNHSERKDKWFYTQLSLGSIKEIPKIKINLPQLLSKKIENIFKTINNLAKSKPYINIVTKEPL